MRVAKAQPTVPTSDFKHPRAAEVRGVEELLQLCSSWVELVPDEHGSVPLTLDLDRRQAVLYARTACEHPGALDLPELLGLRACHHQVGVPGGDVVDHVFPGDSPPGLGTGEDALDERGVERVASPVGDHVAEQRSAEQR